MFKAIVTMCVIGMPNNCITLEDQYGPYETEFECKQRALALVDKCMNIILCGNLINGNAKN
jgi:hypothetical protein